MSIVYIKIRENSSKDDALIGSRKHGRTFLTGFQIRYPHRFHTDTVQLTNHLHASVRERGEEPAVAGSVTIEEEISLSLSRSFACFYFHQLLSPFVTNFNNFVLQIFFRGFYMSVTYIFKN